MLDAIITSEQIHAEFQKVIETDPVVQHCMMRMLQKAITPDQALELAIVLLSIRVSALEKLLADIYMNSTQLHIQGMTITVRD